MSENQTKMTWDELAAANAALTDERLKLKVELDAVEYERNVLKAELAELRAESDLHHRFMDRLRHTGLNELWQAESHEERELTWHDPVELDKWAAQRIVALTRRVKELEDERNTLRMALLQIEMHHTKLNRDKGRPESESRTLAIARAALSKEK